jgi:hypothetical protein
VDDEISVFFFDGSDGCEICSAMTGYSIDVEPEPPHPECSCPITPVEVDGDFEYRNVSTSSHEIEVERSGGSFDNCGSDTPQSIAIPVDSYASMEGPEELIAAAEVELPQGECFELELEMPANTYGVCSYTEVITVVEISGEKWLVATVGDQSVERNIGPETAYVEGTSEIRDLLLNLKSCGRRSPGAPGPERAHTTDGQYGLEHWLRKHID